MTAGSKILPYIIALSALSVSGCAAFYSVYGLSKLFAGASTEVIIMTGSLEFAKLVVASLLYQYWSTINKALRTYLTIACFVLVIITSGGIYGFLSGAYQSTATKSELMDKSLLVLEQKQIRFEEVKTDLKLEKSQLNKSISDLRIALSNPAQVQYVDRETGQLITTSSSSARKSLQKELKTTIEDRNGVNIKLETFTDSLTSVDMQMLNKEISNENERELGPLKYISELTGISMDRVVNWFLLLIIFVFDPLAIAMVIAANFAFSNMGKKRSVEIDEYHKKRNEHLEKVMMSVPEKLKYNTPYSVDEIKEALPKNDLEESYTEKDEKRMDVIGQNGNDGLHYESNIDAEWERINNSSVSIPDVIKQRAAKLPEDSARAILGKIKEAKTSQHFKEIYELLLKFENRG
tara:strand:- start:58637 stop:59857 length:1221 start_codon:yes stop_codon:yes gene_type:complete